MVLSIRVPPRLNAPQAALKLKQLLEANPPYGAHVSFEIQKDGSGWDSPLFQPWLKDSVNKASKLFYGQPANYMGEGGSVRAKFRVSSKKKNFFLQIPFMGMLGEKFPEAQFVITGVLGPASNAHGPNEFLDIEYGKKITGCVAQILVDRHHYARQK